jgi:hypothetical protein
MATNERIRELNQAGIETTRGTDAAATRKVYAVIDKNYNRPVTEFTDRSGTYAGRRRVAYGRPAISFAASDLATFEDLPWWFQLALKGGVAGSGDGGSPVAYTYAFVPSLTTDDLKSITLEFNEAGNPYQSTQVMVNTWTLRIDPDNEGGWMFDAELLGRDWTTASYTGAIADRTTEVIRAPGTKMYLDMATLGSTQLTGKLISASITGNNNLHMKAFAEDDGAWAANKVGRGLRSFDAQFTLEFDSDAQFAQYRATTPTELFIRLEREGSQIHGGTVTNKRARIDMNGYWSTIGWGDREGNIIATFGFQAFYNATSGYDLKAEVVNALSALP